MEFENKKKNLLVWFKHILFRSTNLNINIVNNKIQD